MVNWGQTLKQKWATLRFGDVKVETNGGQHIFEVEVYLNDLDPKAVRVELYADGVKGSAPDAAGDDARRANWPARRAATCIARRCLRPAHQRTIRRASSRTAPVWRCPWKSISFSGSGEATLNGRRTTEDHR